MPKKLERRTCHGPCQLEKMSEEFEFRHRLCRICEDLLKPKTRLCQGCKNERPTSMFYGDSECQICRDAKNIIKICPKCPLDARNTVANFRTPRSRNCLKHESKRKHNPVSDKIWYEKNKVAKIEKVKEWNKANPEKRAEEKRRYRGNHKNEPNFRIKENLSVRLRGLIDKKGSSIIEFLGCSIDELKSWLAFNFDDNMTFANYGEYWHIDHVQPCAAFDLEKDDELKICWHWSNLAPLEGKENASKGNKILADKIEYYKQRRIEYESGSETRRFSVVDALHAMHITA